MSRIEGDNDAMFCRCPGFIAQSRPSEIYNNNNNNHYYWSEEGESGRAFIAAVNDVRAKPGRRSSLTYICGGDVTRYN